MSAGTNAGDSTSASALLVFDLASRRAATTAGDSSAPLAALADGLSRELEPLIHADLPIPARKARMTRYGGRCPEHGIFLDFDPWSPHDHRCPRCERTYQDIKHDDWWAMGAQLWTAERAVHAAALFALRGDRRHGELGARILRTYTDRYQSWPNADNVLGPSRPFFSTYLESIWLLNLCHALALLEGRYDGWTASDGDALRAQLIEPSAALIASYNEGGSNRQVWNEVAINSAWCMLDRKADVRARLDAEFGIRWQIANGLDDDGSWYEGENYHLFAHRGLWYGVQLMRALGEPLAPALDARYSAGFVAPFAGLLPDDTFPSRRDSKYGSSIRQWRIAEWCELGWAHTHDRRLAGVLSTLYHGTVVRRDTMRARSTADAEHNAPPSSLTRADMSWRGLLMANEVPAPSVITRPTSVCLPKQGIAVIRRDRGYTYVALEGGQSGGGHGHPDQLGLTLQTGEARWLDDPGTGGYATADLAWYRSTLAHAAPQFDWQSQEPATASLLAFEDRGEFAWMVKQVEGIAHGIRARRAIVVGEGYLVDVLDWKVLHPEPQHARVIELPIAGKADFASHHRVGWGELAKEMRGNTDSALIEKMEFTAFDDFIELWAHPAFADPFNLHELHRVGASTHTHGNRAHVWYAAPGSDPELEPNWLVRARVPAAPWHGTTDRHWISATRKHGGQIVGVWSWPSEAWPEGAVASVQLARDAKQCVRVTTHDGVEAKHCWTDDGWRIDLDDRGAQRTVSLAGFRNDTPVTKPRPRELAANPRAEYKLSLCDVALAAPPGSPIPGATVVTLGESHYVRTEQSWRDAGAPTATVQIAATKGWLVVDIHAHTGAPVTDVPDESGRLDNECPDVNADGVQWYMGWPDMPLSPGQDLHAAALHVPSGALGGDEVDRGTKIAGHDTLPHVASTLTADGWAMRLRWSRLSLLLDANGTLPFELVVNERPAGRERRRGQLVLSGGGGFGYLAGWRRPTDRFVRLVLP